MFRTLVNKELKSILLGPKFGATFAVCSVLILLSIFIGIQDYKAGLRQYEAGTQLADQEMAEQPSWRSFRTRIFRKPDPMQIFVSGVNNDIGRFSVIRAEETVRLTNSIYSDDPIFAFFRFIDLGFIIQIVLSLFAILFTYDAVSGEREQGTLRLSFANPVPRVQYILAKFVGSWLGLVIPLLVPVLLGLILVVLSGIALTGQHWIRLMMLGGLSVIYFTFFILLGIMVSAMTKKSAVGFLILLVTWVTFVLIIPRMGVMIAGKMVSVPSAAEIEGQVDGFSKDRWDTYMEELTAILEKRQAEMAGMTEEQRQAYRDEHMWDWMEESDETRQKVQTDIAEMSRRLREDLRSKQAIQERLAFALSRVSPSSAFQLAAMTITGTSIDIKTRYEKSLERYQPIFADYTSRKAKEDGDGGGRISISMSSDAGLQFQLGKGGGKLEVSDMPQYQPPVVTASQLFASTLLDVVLLSFFSLLALAGTFVVFLKYDVR